MVLVELEDYPDKQTIMAHKMSFLKLVELVMVLMEIMNLMKQVIYVMVPAAAMVVAVLVLAKVAMVRWE